jgi:hypothetical protein
VRAVKNATDVDAWALCQIVRRLRDAADIIEAEARRRREKTG